MEWFLANWPEASIGHLIVRSCVMLDGFLANALKKRDERYEDWNFKYAVFAP